MWLPLTHAAWMVQALVPVSGIEAAPRVTPSKEPELPAAVVVLDDVHIRQRRGAALLPPVRELDGDEMDAMGVWSIGEMLQKLRDTYGATQAPLVLINGQRVPDPSVFNGFPPDAAVRVEILPAEANAVYGGQPGQAVYNLVLQNRYDRTDLAANLSRPVQGGTSNLGHDIRRSHIRGGRTHNLSLEVSRETALRAQERSGLVDDAQPETGRISLRPERQTLNLSAMITAPIRSWATVASIQARHSRDERTLVQDHQAQASDLQAQIVNASMGASGRLWGWNLTSNLSLNLNNQQVEGFDAQTSENRLGTLNLSGQRPLLELPAGMMTTSINLNLLHGHFETRRHEHRSQGQFESRNVRITLVTPLLAESGQGLGRLGRLQATANLGQREDSSGVGREVALGLSWNRAPGLRLSLDWREQTDPVADIMKTQPTYLGDPRAVFDFRQGKVVEVVPLLGGVADLVPPSSQSLSLNAGVGPFSPWRLLFSLNYSQQRSEDGLGHLTEVTQAVEQAFPDRFVRDDQGRLIQVDFRPLNLSQSWSNNLGLHLVAAWPRPQGRPEAPVINLNLGYGRQLRSQTRLLAHMPLEDRLAGDMGGMSAQNLRLGLDARQGDWGVNLSARWQEGYRSRAQLGRDGPQDLVRKDMTLMDMSLSWRPGTQARSATGAVEAGRRQYGGLEVVLSISNLMDVRPQARLGNGAQAPGFDRDRYDPMGRQVRLSLRRGF